MGTKWAILHLLSITLLAGTCLQSSAQTSTDGQSATNWGNTPGLRSPHPDSKGRSGQWWWPERSQAHAQQLGVGNQGRIYGKWEEKPTQNIDDSPPATVQPVTVLGKPRPTGRTEVRYVWNEVLFDVGSTKPKATELEMLAGYAAAIKSGVIESMVCVGHTDDTGSSESNEQLGLRRAEAVVEFMKAAGVSPERLSAKSMGELRPRTPNDSPANRAFNRRVSFEIQWGKNAP